MAQREKLSVISPSPSGISSALAKACDVSDGDIVYLGPLSQDLGYVYRVEGVYSGSSALFGRISKSMSRWGRTSCHFDTGLIVYVYPHRHDFVYLSIMVLLLSVFAWLLVPDVHKEHIERPFTLWFGSIWRSIEFYIQG